MVNKNKLIEILQPLLLHEEPKRLSHVVSECVIIDAQNYCADKDYIRFDYDTGDYYHTSCIKDSGEIFDSEILDNIPEFVENYDKIMSLRHAVDELESLIVDYAEEARKKRLTQECIYIDFQKKKSGFIDTDNRDFEDGIYYIHYDEFMNSEVIESDDGGLIYENEIDWERIKIIARGIIQSYTKTQLYYPDY